MWKRRVVSKGSRSKDCVVSRREIIELSVPSRFVRQALNGMCWFSAVRQGAGMSHLLGGYDFQPLLHS